MREKYRVKITQSAENDLAEIWAYIATDSVDNANQFILKLESRMNTLAEIASSLSIDFRKRHPRHTIPPSHHKKISNHISNLE